MAKAQIQGKEKDRRILQLTIAEIGALSRSDDIKLYKGIGKMWVSVGPSIGGSLILSLISRFLNVPRTTIEKDLKVEEKGVSDELAALQKKTKFLEKQHQEANSQLRDIVCQISVDPRR